MKLFIILIIGIVISGFLFAEEGFEYDAKDRRDPFIPLLSEGGKFVSDASGINSIKDIILEGIVWDGVDSSLAIINGEIFSEGQEVGPMKILKIEEQGVTFDVDGEEVIIELSEE